MENLNITFAIICFTGIFFSAFMGLMAHEIGKDHYHDDSFDYVKTYMREEVKGSAKLAAMIATIAFLITL